MPRQPRTRGNTDNRLRPDGIEWHVQTQRKACTLTYEGMYDKLYAAMPAIGQGITGFDSTMKVEDVTLKRHTSGKATMTVLLEVSVVPPEDTPAAEQPVYEIEWTSIERPIEQHPIFKTLFPDPTDETEWTQEQSDALYNFQAWESAGDSSTKQRAYDELTDLFQALARKKLRGTTTYVVYSPVASVTQIVRDFVATNACGIYYEIVPGFDNLPEGYKWVSTADHCTRTGAKGKWHRVRQFTGADSVDTDLYEAAEPIDP